MTDHPLRAHRRAAAALAAAATALLVLTGCSCSSSSSDRAETGTTAPDPDRAPAHLRWESWQGVRLPISDDDGPRVTDAAATGYTRTPQGAALAAIQHSTRFAIAPDNVWARVAHIVLADGPGKDDWVTSRVLVSITGPAQSATAPTIAGYTVTAWTPERAAVTVYTTYPDQSAAAHTATVIWSAGDWRLLLPDPNTHQRTMTEIPAVPATAVRLEATR